MAGTLFFRLHVAHIYQRRFDSTSLAQALSGSHWYLLTRRPAVKLMPNSFRYEDEILTADFVTRNSKTGKADVHTLGTDTRHLGHLSDFQIYADGSYFSFRTSETVIHGDSWALASLLAEARGDVSLQEVLYVGQAFGSNNSRNSYERTLTHKKLQRIYEDHIDSGYEIFVVPLACEKSIFISDDHIEDAEPGPDLEIYWRDLVTVEGKVLRASVDLIEHSIISHFSPHYNEKLVEWRASRPTDAMQKMRKAGFRLLHIHLSGWHGLARFYSSATPTPYKSHLISHDLPPSELAAPDVLRGISAQQMSDWRFGSYMLRQGQDIVANLAENSGAAMRIFGDAAPAIRKPSGIKIPPPEVPADTATEHHEVIRGEINRVRESERQAKEPPQHPGLPTYDPHRGTIQIGKYSDGSPSHLQLYDPKTGIIQSVLIIGSHGMGKSASLQTLIIEAYASGVFDVIPVNPLNNDSLADISRALHKDRPLVTSVNDAIHVLEIALRVIEERKEGGYVGFPGRDKPGLFIAIDDADQILRDERAHELVEVIRKSGGRVGVGLMLVVSEISSFELNDAIMQTLVTFPQQLAFMKDGYYVMADLKARYGPKREITWDRNSVTFVLQRDSSNTRLGIIVDTFDPALEPDLAKSKCAQQIIPDEVRVGSWRMIDSVNRWSIHGLNVREWMLARHDDAWAVTVNLATFSNEAFEDAADVLKWANSAFSYRFDGELGRWQAGPTVEGVLTLYADAKREIVPKHRSLESVYQIMVKNYWANG
ncbi:hypothetical protein [Nonomuraea sp. NPDC003754]